ncbi:hypothetical protein HDF19_13020 [Mucilaginibacter sp. E4BP6]|uniref:hypothetical protein n=1 Tax=Mucilaginibacter sp. E4BP6 TaxID=2723089 RepID=UPI0015C6EE43|nr:hypothetical protein [Mucilaginibacter sp. E4BP6]NYE64907.1 hypothetical protein [Mucilaginibacter sp. E4BP6]
MRLFKSKQRVTRQNRVTGYLGQVISHRQRQIADHLNRNTQYWNRSSKLILLLLIFLLFGGASLWLLIRAIY